MQTSQSLQILQSQINQSDLSTILQLLALAVDGKTNQQHTKVYQALNIIQQKAQTYLYFTYIICNKNYNENIRYIAAITMNSSLKRNAKEIHLQNDRKNMMKNTLLQNYIENSPKLISALNILISQFATCFQEMDWQLIQFLMQKISIFPDIIKLLIIIFEDLKHNCQNYCYFEGNQQIIIIKELIQKVHVLMIQIVPSVSFCQNSLTQYANLIQNLIQCIKLVKTITFHLPHKLSNYLQVYCHQVIQKLMQKFCIFLSQVNKQSDHKALFNKWFCDSAQNKLIEQLFESINEIVQTKPDFIITNENLKNMIMSFDTKSFIEIKQMHSILKTWTNILLELLFTEEGYQLISNYLPVLLPNILAGMQYTHLDQIHIKEEMELEHNPYENQNQDQQDQNQDQNLESTYGKNHGSTLRKISITCIQKISQIYSQNLWSLSKQLIQSLLLSQNYKIYQSAILYLGVIAQTCSQQMQLSIRDFIKYLFQRLNDKHQIVIATCLWTLQKLSSMFSDDLNIKFECYKRVFQVVSIPQGMNTANNTKVLMMKQSAISLLDQLIGIQLEIDPNIYEEIIKCLSTGLRQFTGRALFNVFKALSSLFEKPEQQCQKQVFKMIISEICQKWSNSLKSDSVMCPMLQCLVTICQNRKQSFFIYTYDFLIQAASFLNNFQRKAVLLRSIDLISSIIQLVKQAPHSENSANIKNYVNSQAFLFNLHKLVVNEEKEIKHFSYGLLSDIIKLQPLSLNYAEQFIKIIATNIDLNSDTSANNALMCITDLITIHRQCGAKYVEEVMKMVVSFIFKAKNNQLPKIYLLNFSRMFGRLSVLAPQLSKSYLLGGQHILSNLSNGLRGQQLSELTLTSYSSLLKIMNSLQTNNLSTLVQTKEALSFVQSYMEYSHNFKQASQSTQLSNLLLKLKQLICQNNNTVWHQYLSNNTNLLPAVVNKIINMTN